MVEVDKRDWYRFRAEVKQSLNQEQFKLLCELHSKYFNHKFFKPCTCNPKVIKEWIEDINKLYENK
tara:strand:+ start:2330 stop:2527 length:198 start_codon:yes stop_codon:yes gene_type:complete